MNNPKRLLNLALLLATVATGARAIEQDSDGTYLIATVQDYKEFAALVNGGTNTANAHMTADVDLGDEQVFISQNTYRSSGGTMGSGVNYGGTFDGQGHTLTVNLTAGNGYCPTPFSNIQGATIRNLHIAGSITSVAQGASNVAGIATGCGGTNVIENVWVSATMEHQAYTGGWEESAAFVGTVKNGSLTIRDCLFTGSITSKGSYNGCFIGYVDNGSATIENCLSTGTFSYSGGSAGFRGTHTNCYVLSFPTTIPAAMQATAEQIASGEIAYKLQAMRAATYWGQTVGTDGTPVLTNDDSKRVYHNTDGYSNTAEGGTLEHDAEGYYLIGNATDWKRLALIVEDGFGNVNARMTADITVDDNTMMGTATSPFKGEFDGQHHTLTVSYDQTDVAYTGDAKVAHAAFRFISGATIRNLHVAGTITTTTKFPGGIVGNINGGTTNLIEQCRSSVSITVTNNTANDYCIGGIVSHHPAGNSTQLILRDCIFDGAINAPSATGTGGFIGYKNGSATIENCLFAPSALSVRNNDGCTMVRNGGGNLTISNSHYKTALGTVQGNIATDDELSNGHTAFYLQNNRDTQVWGQQIGTDALPMLTSDPAKRVYRAATGFTNNASEAVSDQNVPPFTYTRDSEGNLTITGFDAGFTPPAGYALVIPDEIDGAKVVGIGNNAFRNNKVITSVTIGKNVKTINQYAFAACTALTTVALPADGTLTTLGNSVFEGSTGLTSLVIPNTVTSVGQYLVKSCTNLESLTLSNQMTEIPYEMASGCSKLNNVTIPSSVTTIRAYAFRYCSGLTGIVIPNSVTTMENYVFDNCSALASATFEEGCQLTAIPAWTFNRTALTSFDIPSSVTHIYDNAFCTTKLASITFPSNVTSLGNGSFSSISTLTEVTLPATITSMGNSVFANSAVQTANIFCPNVGISLFNGCKQLEIVNFGDGVKTIGTAAFRYCDKLATVNIPASVTSIGNHAFANNPALTTVNFAEGINLTTLQDGTFGWNAKLDNFTIPASVTTLQNSVFESCTGMTSLVIPNTVTSVGQAIVKACTALESLTLSNQITEITYEMASGCTKINNVTIPSSVTGIRAYAFRYCSGLTGIVIPNSVTTMENYVFDNCSTLTSVTFEEGCLLTAIPAWTFNRTALTSFDIPNGIITINDNAFRECSALQTITIPASVRTIGNSAFRYCSSLNNVTLPGTLREIQDWSFANCTGMENLTIEEGVPSINRDVFQYSGMKHVVLPASLGNIGVNLFYQCNQLETLDLSKCVNVYELYNYTALRGSNTIFYGVPTTTKIILPPYTKATLGTNDERATVDFNLAQDADGYYLINSANDWDKFAVYTRENPTANARLNADIDLTGHVAMLGVGNDMNNHIDYKGTFDGQRHTLTLNHTATKDRTAPFAYVAEATIKRLKVAGSLTSRYIHTAALVGGATTSLAIEDCEVAATINSDISVRSDLTHGGFIGDGATAQITLTDCLFSGALRGGSSVRYTAAFLAWMGSGRITYNQCLNIGTSDTQTSTCYALGRTQYNGQTTATLCYYNSSTFTPNGSGSENLIKSIDATQLANGKAAYLLQGGREEQHWGQKIGTDPHPMLTDASDTRVYRGNTYTNEPTEYAGLQQDSEGYYLIGSTTDWEEFCDLTQDVPTANAKMTADVTVAGNAMVGTAAVPYNGEFDGQGHTLTVNYDRTGLPYSQSMDTGAAPFLFINVANIHDLHTAGTIRTSTKFAGGVVGDIQGLNNLIERCRSSIVITSTVDGEGCMGGIVSHMGNNGKQRNFIIRDCLFDGRFDAPTAWGNGGIMGYKNGDGQLINCLYAPTGETAVATKESYTIVRHAAFALTLTNCHYSEPMGTVQGTLAEADNLASGKTAFDLQNNRAALAWGQEIGVDTHPIPTTDVSKRVYHTIDGYSNTPDEGALQQDSEGFYLLSTATDWKRFALMVEDGQTDANARMTADINLGNELVMIGSGTAQDNDGNGNVLYQGHFDGQGHTLTINFTTDELYCAPFRHIKGATIENLRVSGNIATSNKLAAGIVACTYGQQVHSYIKNCVSEVNITSSFVNNGDAFYDASHHGGIAARLWYYGQLHISDCLFTGSISGETKGVTWGGLLGIPDGTVTIKNCLQAGTLTATGVTSGSNGAGTFSSTFGSGFASRVNISNSYYLTSFGNTQGTLTTAEALADGSVVTLLQAGREQTAWEQDTAKGLPMPRIFANRAVTPLGDVNSDGSVDMGDVMAIKDHLLGHTPDAFNATAADVNGDGQVSIADVAALLHLLLHAAD